MSDRSETKYLQFEFFHEEKKLIIGLIIFFATCLFLLLSTYETVKAYQLIVSSLVLGILYSVLALGFSVILGIAKQFKLSLGGYYVLAAYTMYFLLKTIRIDLAVQTENVIDGFLFLALFLLPIVLMIIILIFLKTEFDSFEFLLLLTSPIIPIISVILLGGDIIEGLFVGLVIPVLVLAAWFLELPKRKTALGAFILGLLVPVLIILGQQTRSIFGLGIPVVYLALMMLAVIFTSGIAMLSDRYLIERVRKSIVNVMIVTFAMALLLESVVQILYFPEGGQFLIFGGELRNLQAIVPQNDLLKIKINDNYVVIPYIRLVSLFFCIFAVFLLYIFIFHTRIGRALRAVSQDDEAAALVGIDIRKISAIVTGLGMAMIGFAAILTSPFAARPQWGPHMGWSVLIMAIAIVTLGGMGSLLGSVFAGFIFSFTEVVISSNAPAVFLNESTILPYINDYIPFIPNIIIPDLSPLSVLVPFLMVFLVMILKPKGLLGIEEEIE